MIPYINLWSLQHSSATLFLLHKNFPKPSSDHVPSPPSQRKEKPSDVNFSTPRCKPLTLPYHSVFLQCVTIQMLFYLLFKAWLSIRALDSIPLTFSRTIHFYYSRPLFWSQLLFKGLLFGINLLNSLPSWGKKPHNSPPSPWPYPTTSLCSSASQPNCSEELSLFIGFVSHLLLPPQPL